MTTLTSLQPLGEIEVLVGYTVIPGERAGDDGPGAAEIVRVTEVTLWDRDTYTLLDAAVFAPVTLVAWEAAIAEENRE